MRLGLAGLCLALLLAGCGRSPEAVREETAMDAMGVGGYAETTASADGRYADADMAARTAAPPPPAAPAPSDQPNQTTQPTPGAQQPSGPSPVLFLAYSYRMSLELPGARLAGVMDGHVRACQQAGPRLCQLISSARSGDPESSISGAVELRGEPAWLQNFMNGVVRDTEAADGRVRARATETEDLTRQIVDTEARLRAARTLRERLQRLLASRPGRLSDLLETERELARVQGEIDATESSLAVMRTRVAMSALTLTYQSEPRPLRSDTFRPLGDAVASFLGIVMEGFAFIIVAVAGLLPFVIVFGPVVWLLLRWRKRRGGRFFNFRRKSEAPPPAPAPPAG